MTHRLFLGFVLAATLAACSSGGGTAGSPATASDAATTHADGVAGTVRTDVIILQGVPPATVAVNNQYTYRPTVPANSGTVTFTITGLPAWASFNADDGSLSGTPGTANVGLTAPITITAHNGIGTGSVGPFTIVISAEPIPTSTKPSYVPVISGIPAGDVVAGQGYSFKPEASDPAGLPVVFSIINRPSWAIFNVATGQLSGTPSAAELGIFPAITISVSDGTASTELATFAIDVIAPAAAAPVLGGTASTSVIAGHAYRFQPTVTDPAGLTPIFSIAHSPDWAAFDKATGAITGTPSIAQAANYPNIVISASNGLASASLKAFSITVTNPDAPVIGGTPAGTGTAGQLYSFTPAASDPAGASLTFSIANAPIWAAFNRATGELSGTPSPVQTGTYAGILISVSNGSSSATLPAFSIAIAKGAPPTIGGTPRTSDVAGSAYGFTPTSTDPSGGTLTFSIQNAPAWSAFSTSTGTLSGTPTAADVGTYANIKISVSDGESLAALAPFTIAVTSAGGGGNPLTSIALAPLAVTLAPAAAQQLTVTGTYGDGSTAPITSGATFQSSNTNVATVSATGVVTVVAGATVGASASISATDTAAGLTTSSANSTVVVVKAPANGIPTATSVSAAATTAQTNSLCTLLGGFYWEIGNEDGALASGSLGLDGSGAPVLANTNVSIASASKWLYATYVTQLRGSAANLTSADVNFLHFTSGYTNMGSDTNTSGTSTGECPSTDNPDSINACLAQINPANGMIYGAQIPANIGIFVYDSGHMEKHASLYTGLGNVVVGSLASEIWTTYAVGNAMDYTEPLLAGGLYGNADEYTSILRAVLSGGLAMKDALGIDAVCTHKGGNYTQNPVGICVAGGSPIPENWHYSIGHWVEDDPVYNNDGAFSSPGKFGFYPWIDSTKTYYGVISRFEQSNSGGIVQQGYASQQCGQLVRRAWMTGKVQTGALPTG